MPLSLKMVTGWSIVSYCIQRREPLMRTGVCNWQRVMPSGNPRQPNKIFSRRDEPISAQPLFSIHSVCVCVETSATVSFSPRQCALVSFHFPFRRCRMKAFQCRNHISWWHLKIFTRGRNDNLFFFETWRMIWCPPFSSCVRRKKPFYR
jgi:hypothetical protein